jgi:hypothetical protein
MIYGIHVKVQLWTCVSWILLWVRYKIVWLKFGVTWRQLKDVFLIEI